MVLFTTNESTTPFGNKSKVVWCFSLGVVCLTCAGVLLAVDLVFIVTQYRMRVTNGSAMHEFLMKRSDVIHLSVFLFNITNGPRFRAGEDHKLRLQEVGPFTYRETRVNEDLEIDEEAGLIRYRPRIDSTFLPENSVAHPDDVILTLPNLAVMGLASMLSSYPFWTRAGLELLTSQLDSQPLVTLDAGSYMWGYQDPIVALANKLAPGIIYFDKLGILDRLYDKQTPNYLEVSARNEDKFMIKTRNGQKKLAMGKMNNVDDCEACDDFTDAYEGLGYPSPTTRDTPINLFRNGLCKLLPVDFDKEVVLDSGVRGLVYNLSDRFYAQAQGRNHTKNSILDLRSCFYGIPLALSKLYFMGMDPEFSERIEGLPEPDPSRGSYLIIEPLVALELETVVRVQLNLVLEDVGFNTRTRPFANMVIPIAYIEIIQPPLPEETVQGLRLMYVTAPLLVLLLQLALLLAGASLVSYPFIVCIVNRDKAKHLPTVKDTQQPLLIVTSKGVVAE